MNKAVIAIWAAAALVWTAGGAYVLWPNGDEDSGPEPTISSERASAREGTRSEPTGPADGPPPTAPGVFAVDSSPLQAVEVELRPRPAAGLLFDVDTGEVLWKQSAARELPIASLTKMMTALMISRHHRFKERVLISKRAAETNGSKLGVLVPGTKVPLKPLFYGLIMASGNDAAVALAEHDAGSVRHFVASMNREARLLGLSCTHFTTPSGLKNQGNYSCALDLAALARADLSDARIARVAATTDIKFPFRGRVSTLEIFNNHFFATHGIPGLRRAEVTGLKTGLTLEAGRCYVTTARLGNRHLGVVLLNSQDPISQVPKLLRAGFGVR